MEYKAINHVVAKKDSQAGHGPAGYTDGSAAEGLVHCQGRAVPDARAIVKKVGE